MRYAKVVLGLPVEGPFDYSIPQGLSAQARPGCRVWVNFRTARAVGYIVAVAARTQIPRVKPLLACIDTRPVLERLLLELTREIARNFGCSWGEAIETALPGPLRSGRVIAEEVPCAGQPREGLARTGVSVAAVQDPDGQLRWQEYLRSIKATLAGGRSAIVVVPDVSTLEQRSRWLRDQQGLPVSELYRQQHKEFLQWCRLRGSRATVVVGTRSALFAPLGDVGLIIVDDENDPAYKQDQVPHYHARDVALMRARLEPCSLIFGGYPLSLELGLLVQQHKAVLQPLEPVRPYPRVTVVDMKNLPLLDRKKKIIISRLVQDAIATNLAAGGNVLVFLNRKGFATQAVCSTCGQTLKCPRCSINLVYFYSQNRLACHYCNFSLEPPKVCPLCNAGYIKYSGAGTEKLESEVARIFPSAKISLVSEDSPVNSPEPGICIASQKILKGAAASFDTVVCLGIDHGLNHIDFRAAEKSFALLTGLVRLTRNDFFVQTNIAHHYCFEALQKNDPALFYEQEMRFRRQLKLPPVRHLAAIKLRGAIEANVSRAAEELYERLRAKAGRDIAVLSVNPASIPRLRGKFYWTVMASAASRQGLNRFVKNSLKDFRQTGIIVTVDIDPL